MASKAIQSVFRGYLARKEVWLMKEMIRIRKFESAMKEEIQEDGVWWANRKTIPSLKQKPYNVMNFVEDEDEPEVDDDGNIT